MTGALNGKKNGSVEKMLLLNEEIKEESIKLEAVLAGLNDREGNGTKKIASIIKVHCQRIGGSLKLLENAVGRHFNDAK